MSHSTYSTIHLARYRLSFRVTETLHLPAYAGSALRGAFGHALMYLSGINKNDIEERNDLFLQSPYAKIFDPQQTENSNVSLSGIQQLPVPYVIEAPLSSSQYYQPEDILIFHHVLFGPALNHLSLIILAWRRALLRGLGKGDGKAELICVEQELAPGNWGVIYTEEEPLIKDHSVEISLTRFHKPQDVHLHLRTPLRIQHRGKILGPREVNGSLFLRQLIRRISLCTHVHQNWQWPLELIRELNELADHVKDDRRLHWQEWGRYSSRQHQAMQLGGIVGHWYLEQVPVELLHIIYLGQWFHLGKETAFGLGKYEWIEEPWKPRSAIINQELFSNV
jgi:hypothetical protein